MFQCTCHINFCNTAVTCCHGYLFPLKNKMKAKTILILYDMFIFLRKSRVIYFLKNFFYRHRNNKKAYFPDHTFSSFKNSTFISNL